MTDYHLRRKDKEITEEETLKGILKATRYVTIAMCRSNEPYLVTLSHSYDPGTNLIYFHCAQVGKKIDFLRSNPIVWGQAVEDLGYREGECDHAYRCVMFRGRVSFLDSFEKKRAALELMIRRHESKPEPVMGRTLTPEKLAGAAVGVIEIEMMTGKRALSE
jgi:nitroimidazol reductase NimA-like FMN-containing flavoprotein (pyridoxamine 5'-phosphate oxidase superfamily)